MATAHNRKGVPEALIRKIGALPVARIAEVEDFVDFLAARANRRAAFDHLLAIAPALEAAGVGASGEDEADGEIRAARAARS